MARLLLLIAIVIVAFLIVKRLFRSSTAGRAESAAEEAPSSTGTPQEKLVRCVQCGAFVRKADALPDPRGFRCKNPECAKSN